MIKSRIIRFLCITLVGTTLALAIILVFAVLNGVVTLPSLGEETESPRRPFGGTFDLSDILGSLDPKDLSDFTWETLSPEDFPEPDMEFPPLPSEWDTLPPEWDTLPSEWGEEDPLDPEELGGLLAGMNGDLAMPSALAAGVASQLTVMTVTSQQAGPLYLKVKSHGVYTGQGWGEVAEPFDRRVGEGYSAVYLPYMLMDMDTPFEGYALTVEPVMSLRAIPYYLTTNYEGDGQMQLSEAEATGPSDTPYTLFYRPLSAYLPAPLAGEPLASYEAAYAAYARDNYLEIDETSLAYLRLVIEQQGFRGDDPEIIQKVAVYIQNAAEYALDYDQRMDQESNVVVAFLAAYKKGVCRHFASAATLLYRALGIPARYTVGFMTSVEAGVPTAVKGKDGHAWVEVYVDGFGWQYVEVTGGSSGDDPLGENPSGGDSSGEGSGGTDPVDPSEDWIDLMTGRNGFLYPNGRLPEGAKDTPLLEVISSCTGRTLLKLHSFGAYDGQAFQKAEEEPPLLPAGTSSAFLTGQYLEASGLGRRSQMRIRTLRDIYVVPYYVDALPWGAAELEVGEHAVTGEGTMEYMASFFTDTPGYAPTGYEASGAEHHAVYAPYAYANYLAVEGEVAEHLELLVEEMGWRDLEREKMIPAVVAYLGSTCTLNEAYDKGLDREENPVKAFLEVYREGSIRYFAATATLIYRTLGIPTRYTVGFLAQTEMGRKLSLKGEDAYAWCEVYIDSIGWVALEVIDEGVQRQSVTLKPADMNVLYKAGETVTHNGLLEGFESFEAQGYTYKATVTREGDGPGQSALHIESLTILDPQGVDVTHIFDLTLEEGTLWVYIGELYLKSTSATKTYDGTPFESVEVQISEGSLPQGYFLVILPSARQQKDVGVCTASFRVMICYEEAGEIEDRTLWFSIRKEYGTHTITPAQLVIQAKGGTKTYDGSPLSAEGYEILEGSLAPGDHIAHITLEGSQTRIGRSESVITELEILNRNGENVTHNYAIETLTGMLQILPP